MAKNKKSSNEQDSTYLLKILLYLVLGSIWLKVQLKNGTEVPLPVGALVGLLFAAHEHFQLDRKIEYAVLLVAMFVGYWVPTGFEIILSKAL